MIKLKLLKLPILFIFVKSSWSLTSNIHVGGMFHSISYILTSFKSRQPSFFQCMSRELCIELKLLWRNRLEIRYVMRLIILNKKPFHAEMRMPIRLETKLASYFKFKMLFEFNKNASDLNHIRFVQNDRKSFTTVWFGNLILESSVVSHGKMRAFALFHLKKNCWPLIYIGIRSNRVRDMN